MIQREVMLGFWICLTVGHVEAAIVSVDGMRLESCEFSTSHQPGTLYIDRDMFRSSTAECAMEMTMARHSAKALGPVAEMWRCGVA
ncbi:hypothetical protein J1614_006585 [Plenodomus biglobosus]|nr:hypothetical protein J1614_006585 [Plenodomus biglobosus]